MLKVILTYVVKTMPRQLPDVMQRLVRSAARLWRVSPRPRLRTYPRRARCGLTLFEAVPIAQQGVRLAEHYIRQQAGVQESRLLTQVVTAASTYALRDLNDRINSIVGLNRIQVLDLEDLAAANAWVPTKPTRTSRGLEIQVIFHARGSKELVVLAHAFTPTGENHQPYMPRGGIGIGLVGTILEREPTMLVGPGLNYDLGALQAQATTQGNIHLPVAGDQLAIAVLRMDQDVLPFLHRVEVPGLPALNQMQTDLDMGGFDLVGVGDLVADKITVENGMEINELRGTLDVEGNINAGGDLNIPGTLTSAEAEIDGRIEADGLKVTGWAELGSVQALSMQVTGSVRVTKAVTVDGQISAGTLAAGNVVANEIAASKAIIGTLQAGDVTSSGKLEVETVVVTEELFVTGGCTGC